MIKKSLNRNSLAVVGAAAAIAASVIVLSGDVHADHRGSDDDFGGKHNHLAVLKTFDKNGDRKLTQEEIDLGRAEQLARFDGDSDQHIDINEYSNLWLQSVRSRMVDRFQSLDENGDGKISIEELTAPTADIVERKDRNDDGSLSGRELRRDDDDDWR